MSFPMIKNNKGEWELINIPFTVLSIPQHLSQKEKAQVQKNIGLGNENNDASSFSSVNSAALATDCAAFGGECYAGFKITRANLFRYEESSGDIILSIGIDDREDFLEFIEQIGGTSPYNNEQSSDKARRRLYFHILDAELDLVYNRFGYLQGTYTENSATIPGYQLTDDWYDKEYNEIFLKATTNTAKYCENITSESELYLMVERYPEIGTTVSGGYAFAAGEGAIAGGYYGVALGRDTQALNNAAVAIGHTSVSSGKYSISMGVYANALASSSLAIGRSANVSFAAKYGTAIGYSARSTAEYSTAIQGTASGSKAVAIGYEAKAQAANSVALVGTASGLRAIALGSGAIASGERSTAFNASTASALHSIAIATGSAKGEYSLAFGPSSLTETTAKYGLALGYNTKSEGQSSIAIGQGLQGRAYQTVVGNYNVDTTGRTWDGGKFSGTDGAVFIVGCGLNGKNRRNALVVWEDGRATLRKGPVDAMDVATKEYVDEQTVSSGKTYTDAQIAIVRKEANDNLNLAYAYTDKAVVGLATTEYVNNATTGLANTTYVDNKVKGLATETYVQEQVAGIKVTNELDARLLIGRGAGSIYTGAGSSTNLNSYSAFGTRSFVIGSSSKIPSTDVNWTSTVATNWSLLNEQGWFNLPFTANIGANSLIVGKDLVTLDYNSAAIGMNNIAGSRSCVAMGEGVIAYRRGQVVVGRFNAYSTPTAAAASGSKAEPIFIVGNGSSTNRKNALEILMNGNAVIAGNLTLNGTPTEDNHAATIGYIKTLENRVAELESQLEGLATILQQLNEGGIE